MVGKKLHASHREETRRIHDETYNRILAAEGPAAAAEYRRTPQVDITPGVLGFYEDHQTALVLSALTVLLVGSYFALWFGLTRLYGYIRYGRKGQQATPPIDSPATPLGNSGVTKGPPSGS
jgi:hypothetical protein